MMNFSTLKKFGVLCLALFCNNIVNSMEDLSISSIPPNFTISEWSVSNLSDMGNIFHITLNSANNKNDLGNKLSVKHNTLVIKDCEILVGEKDNDDDFVLQNYATLKIGENTKLIMDENSLLRVQRDGKLINRGEIILNNGSELVTSFIDSSSSANSKHEQMLRYGIDNTNGIIRVKKGSKLHWQKRNDSGDDKKSLSIYGGTLRLGDSSK